MTAWRHHWLHYIGVIINSMDLWVTWPSSQGRSIFRPRPKLWPVCVPWGLIISAK